MFTILTFTLRAEGREPQTQAQEWRNRRCALKDHTGYCVEGIWKGPEVDMGEPVMRLLTLASERSVGSLHKDCECGDERR